MEIGNLDLIPERWSSYDTKAEAARLSFYIPCFPLRILSFIMGRYLYAFAVWNFQDIVRFWSFFGPYFLAFGLNMERYGVYSISSFQTLSNFYRKKVWYESLWKKFLIRGIAKLDNLINWKTITSKTGMKKHYIVVV